VAALVRDGVEVKVLKSGETGQIVLNQTPFYAESGGQVGDRGMMRGDGVSVEVTETQKKLGDVFVHTVHVLAGELTVGRALELEVDHARRGAIRANHSATHLLHEALRMTLGDHVAQKGSLVAPDRLRFDFSHPKAISDAELETVEGIANRVILQNEPVTTRLMGVDEAIQSGARALFGEKYGDEVRVVTMGTLREGAGAGRNFSIELCGGTHVGATGDIGLVTIVGEGAVAAGVRRVEAMTGEAARRYLAEESRKLRELAGLLKTTPSEAAQRLSAVLDERRKLERELAEARKKLAMGGGAAGADPVREIAGVRFLGRSIAGVEMKDLKGLADEAKKQVGSGIVAIVGVGPDGKAGVVVGVTEDMTARYDAVALVRAASEALGGKGGGGRRDMAQAGGPDGAKADEALVAIEKVLAA
jgi:alanyl-tRNA synthetase